MKNVLSLRTVGILAVSSKRADPIRALAPRKATDSCLLSHTVETIFLFLTDASKRLPCMLFPSENTGTLYNATNNFAINTLLNLLGACEAKRKLESQCNN